MPTAVIDSFTLKPYLGNPAAVCFLARHDVLHDDILQAIAAEMNLSETAFVFPLPETTTALAATADGATTAIVTTTTTSAAAATAPLSLGIRWLTPETEVGFCGHATLAAAHAVFTEPSSQQVFPFLFSAAADGAAAAPPASIRFVGTAPMAGNVEMTVAPQPMGAWSARAAAALEPAAAVGAEAAACGRHPGFVPARKAHYVLDFPERMPEPTVLAPDQVAALSAALGLQGGASDIVEILLHKPSRKYVVVVRDATMIATLRVNASLLASTFHPPQAAPLSVTVTGSSVGSRFTSTVHGDHDIVSRHFAPWVGIDEDPVTGAAHIVVAPYWFKKLHTTTGVGATKALRCYQASARGGWMCVVAGPRPGRLSISASATTMTSGVHYACVNYRRSATSATHVNADSKL